MTAKNIGRIIVLAGALVATTATARVFKAENLVINGNFSAGLAHWDEHLSMTGNLGSSDISVTAEGELKITGYDGANFSYGQEQSINITNTTHSYRVSFDWKSTNRETPWGSNGVFFYIYDSTNALIAHVCYWNTGQPTATPNPPSGVPDDAFYCEVKRAEVHDWESVSFDTKSLTGLDHSAISRIVVRPYVHNDAGSGGELYVDNIMIQEAYPEKAVVWTEQSNTLSNWIPCVNGIYDISDTPQGFFKTKIVFASVFPSNGHYYAYAHYSVSWSNANEIAQSLGGYLATITSAEENQFVADLIESEGSAWIGLFQDPAGSEPSEGWQWVTGEPLSYTGWNDGEPNQYQGAEEDYGVLGSSTHHQSQWRGKWADIPIDAPSSTGFVIEFE